MKGSVCQLLFSLQVTIHCIEYMEWFHRVRSGNKRFDNHCLSSTLGGDMSELINLYRRDTFLVYLQCQKLCEYHSLPLTEDILIKGKSFGGLSQKDALDVHLRLVPLQLTCTQPSHWLW